MADIKQQNVKWLGVYAVAHAIVLAGLALDVPLSPADVSMRDVAKATLGAIAALAAAVLTDSASSDWKDRLVYWRWHHPLPGCRAFSALLLRADSRINSTALLRSLGGTFPHGPANQNQVWYQLYKVHENDGATIAGNRRWVLYRDLTWLGLILTVFGGLFALLTANSTLAATAYVLCSAMFLAITWHAAWRNGERFVLTVLAIASAAAAKKEGSTC